MDESTDSCTTVWRELSMVSAVMPTTGSQRANSQYDGISPATISASAKAAAASTSTVRRG
jgi:hypothetical protein